MIFPQEICTIDLTVCTSREVTTPGVLCRCVGNDTNKFDFLVTETAHVSHSRHTLYAKYTSRNEFNSSVEVTEILGQSPLVYGKRTKKKSNRF